MFRRNKSHKQEPPADSLRIPVVDVVLDLMRLFRRWTSRAEWGRRILGAQPVSAPEGDGLVLIQIDGLPRRIFEGAIRDGKMKFARQILEREGYELHTHYSGLPSTTAAVQGELFFGEKTAVPSFGFGDRRAGEVLTMLDPDVAKGIESRINQGDNGLLRGGSGYCNVYTGGAAEPHFSAACMGWRDLLQGVSLWRGAIFVLFNFGSLVVAVAQCFIELGVAITDCFRGIVPWKELWEEIKFIPSRVLVGVLLRELMTICAGIDVARGLPIVQLNFVGYDEHGHRRGPDSMFARWTLRGIDRCIRRVWRAASHSEQRHYRVWIYSDHGQEVVTPYDTVTGRSFFEAIRDAFKPQYGESLVVNSGELADKPARVRHMRRVRPRKSDSNEPVRSQGATEIILAAIGPIGHIYFPEQPPSEQIEEGCRTLVGAGQVPLVLIKSGEGSAEAWTADGTFRLPEDRARIFGEDHPFLDSVSEDLIRLCHHTDAGDIVVAGWRAGTQPMTFVYEHGAHGGAGLDETCAFALLPSDTELPQSVGTYMRPTELRAAALHALNRPEYADHRPPVRRRKTRETLRVMTYNVHSCQGLDGRLSVSRIARVIAQCDADVVALQELDLQRPRSQLQDQAQELARQLGMQFHFHPAISVASEAYGDAILSRYPLRLIKAQVLPGKTLLASSEPRGAIWVEVETPQGNFQVFNTHLGLRLPEQMEQIEALLGPEWIGNPECKEPYIVCGDLNAGPRSPVYRLLAERHRDAQHSMNGQRPRGTWLSTHPMLRIDHLFVSRGLAVSAVDVPRTTFIRNASDHLPVVVDVQFEKEPPARK